MREETGFIDGTDDRLLQLRAEIDANFRTVKREMARIQLEAERLRHFRLMQPEAKTLPEWW